MGPNIITCSLQGRGRRVRVRDRYVTREVGVGIVLDRVNKKGM